MAEANMQVSLGVLVALQATLVALASTEHTVFQPVLVASSALQMYHLASCHIGNTRILFGRLS